MLGVALLVWLGTAVWWWRTRAPRPSLEREHAERRERRRRVDPLTTVLDEDTEYWERV